jgi:hypothetical protein
MQPAHRFLARVVVAALGLVALLLALDGLVPARLLMRLPGAAHRDALSERAALQAVETELLFLGDSTNMFPDPERGRVSTSLFRALGMTGTDLSAMGYGQGIFGGQLELLARGESRPRAVVVPVNLRSFSAIFVARHRWTGHELVLRHGLYFGVRALEVFKVPLSGADDGFVEQPITYRGRALGRRSGLIGAPVPLPVTTGTPDHAAALSRVEQQARLSLLDNYASPIEHTAELAALRRTLHAAASLEPPVLFYLTPLNVALMEAVLSAEERADIGRNLALLSAVLEQSSQRYLDLSRWLTDGASFCDPAATPAEHLCPEARKRLGARLASWVSAELGRPGG